MADRRDRVGQHRRGHRGQPGGRRPRGGGHDLDPARDGGRRPARRAPPTSVRWPRRPRSRCCRCPRPRWWHAVAGAWAAAAQPGSVLVDLSTNSPAAVRRLGERLAGSGHHLVEAPLTGGAIGAERRMLVFMVGGDDEPVARVLPVLEPLGRATFHVGALGTRQHHEAAQQPHRLHHDLGQPRGVGDGDQGGHRGPRRRGDPAHRRGVQLLHRPSGRDHRRARPAHPVRAGAGGQGRRPDRGYRRRARCPHAGGGGRQRRARRRAVDQGLGGADWSELVTLAERQADVALRWGAPAD